MIRIMPSRDDPAWGDVHDAVGGRLLSAALLLQALEAELEGQQRDRLARARTLVEEALASVRVAARGEELVMGAAPFAQRLETVCDTVRALGVECILTWSAGVDEPPAALSSALELIAREAVANAVRHARPQRIGVSVQVDAGGWHLSVADDGGGDDVKASGVGMASMRRRALRLGGELHVERGRSGTTVFCHLPTKS